MMDIYDLAIYIFFFTHRTLLYSDVRNKQCCSLFQPDGDDDAEEPWRPLPAAGQARGGRDTRGVRDAVAQKRRCHVIVEPREAVCASARVWCADGGRRRSLAVVAR